MKIISISLLFIFALISNINADSSGIKNSKDYYFSRFFEEFSKAARPQSEISVDFNQSMIKLKKIKENLSDDGVVFLTHGTLGGVVNDSDYYFTKDGIRDDRKYLNAIKKFTGASRGYVLKWPGDNSQAIRENTAAEFSKVIRTKIRLISEKNGVEQNKIPIILVGHSFGASVMLDVSDMLAGAGYNVELLFTFNCPNNSYAHSANVQHVNIYSNYDWIVQLFCNMYFNGSYANYDFCGPARVTFDNAVNICFDMFYDEKRYKYFKKGRPDKIVMALVRHHGTRTERLLSDIDEKLSSLDVFENGMSAAASRKIDGRLSLTTDIGVIQKEITVETNGSILKIIDKKTDTLLYSINIGKEYKTYIPLKFIPLLSMGFIKESLTIKNNKIIYDFNGFISIFGEDTGKYTRVKIDTKNDMFYLVDITDTGKTNLVATNSRQRTTNEKEYF